MPPVFCVPRAALAAALRALALLAFATTAWAAPPLNINPYGIPMGGGSCTPGSVWYADGCAGVPRPVIEQPLCPVYAPPGHSNLLSSQDVRCRPACADTIPSGHQGQVVDVQSTNSNAPCYTPPMCSDSYPLGFLGTIIPIQSTDPNAACYLAPMCRGQAPPGYLGRIIPVQSTYPGGDCYLAPVCADIALPGYLGQIIPVQNTDPNAMCYVTSWPPLCQGVAPVGYPGQVIPTQSTDRNASCFVEPPPLCANDAPPGYLGTIIPMQSTDPYAACFVTPPPMCADDAPPGYLGTIIPMQSTDRNAACFVTPPPLCANVAPPGYLGTIIPMQSINPGALCYEPPALAECTEIVVSDIVPIAVTHGRGSTIGHLLLPTRTWAPGSGVPGLAIVDYDPGTRNSFWFGISWPGHEGETVHVGAEVLDTAPNARHPMVSRVHVMGESGWDFSQGLPYSSDRFVGPWVTDAYTNHRLIWVNTSQGHACFYYREAENRGYVGQSVGDLSLLPGSGFTLLSNHTWCDLNHNSGDCGR